MSPESTPEELRVLAIRIAAAYEGGDTFDLDSIYGSRLGAVRALGAVVATRAEALAGITGAEIAERHEDRMIEALSTGGEIRAAQTGLMDGDDAETRADLARLADGYRAALAEIRPMGGNLATRMPENYDHEAFTAVQQAAQDYPADWVAASNNRGELHIAQSNRGFYRDAEVYTPEKTQPIEPAVWHLPAGSDPADEFLHSPPRTVAVRVPDEDNEYGDEGWLVTSQEFNPSPERPPGDGWESYRDDKQTGWVRPVTEVVDHGPEQLVGLLSVAPVPGLHGPDPAPYAAVATHELAHRMELSVPGVGAMEADWLKDRTKTADGQHEALTPMGGAYGGHETGYRDQFINTYIGRAYDQDLVPGGHEIVSMGWEGMLHGRMGGLVGASERYRADDDMRWLVLGVLAAAGLPFLAVLDVDSITVGLI